MPSSTIRNSSLSSLLDSSAGASSTTTMTRSSCKTVHILKRLVPCSLVVSPSTSFYTSTCTTSDCKLAKKSSNTLWTRMRLLLWARRFWKVATVTFWTRQNPKISTRSLSTWTTKWFLKTKSPWTIWSEWPISPGNSASATICGIRSSRRGPKEATQFSINIDVHYRQ